MDDIASTGRTLAMAAQLLLEAGAKSVDVAITHALFGNDVFMFLKQSGIANVWSTDTVLHPTNAVSILPAIADAIAEPGSIN
jgi:ribose-phosphate pyrophosphokinase